MGWQPEYKPFRDMLSVCLVVSSCPGFTTPVTEGKLQSQSLIPMQTQSWRVGKWNDFCPRDQEATGAFLFLFTSDTFWLGSQ